MDQVTPISIPRFYNLQDIEAVSNMLDKSERRPIRYAPWGGGKSQPQAAFAIAYGDGNIYLKYYITESFLKAEYSRFNDPVFEDSCVEFFIAFGNDVNYYNLEFNCTGTSRVQYGQHKTGRTFIPASLLKTIEHQTRIKAGADNIEWELTLCIPQKLFKFHPRLSLANSKASVNFYKCGDGLPEPHFLCWNNIENLQPEFHLSGFFREITFDQGAN